MDEQHVPQYIRIKSYLQKLIQEKQPHSRMPSEAELSRIFGVSRGTVKQAIMDLVYEGALYREQGKGTFVSEKKISRSFKTLPSFTNDIRRMGVDPHTQLLSLRQQAPSPYLTHLFQLTPGEQVIRFKRLVSTEGVPVVVLSSYLNPHIYPALTSEEINESLYEALQNKYGVIPTKARDTYSIVDASPQTAELLQCKKNSVVCFSRRVGYLPSGVAVEYVESFIRYDRFMLDVSIGMDFSDYDTPSSDIDSTPSGSPYDVGVRNILI